MAITVQKIAIFNDIEHFCIKGERYWRGWLFRWHVNLECFQFNDQSAAYDLQFLQTSAWVSGSWAFDNNEIITTGKTKCHSHSLSSVEPVARSRTVQTPIFTLHWSTNTSHNPATLNKNRDIKQWYSAALEVTENLHVFMMYKGCSLTRGLLGISFSKSHEVSTQGSSFVLSANSKNQSQQMSFS